MCSSLVSRIKKRKMSYKKSNIILVIKSRISWMMHVVYVGEMRDAHRILAGKI
jgi:hypothetical protein